MRSPTFTTISKGEPPPVQSPHNRSSFGDLHGARATRARAAVDEASGAVEASVQQLIVAKFRYDTDPPRTYRMERVVVISDGRCGVCEHTVVRAWSCIRRTIRRRDGVRARRIVSRCCWRGDSCGRHGLCDQLLLGAQGAIRKAELRLFLLVLPREKSKSPGGGGTVQVGIRVADIWSSGRAVQRVPDTGEVAAAEVSAPAPSSMEPPSPRSMPKKERWKASTQRPQAPPLFCTEISTSPSRVRGRCGAGRTGIPPKSSQSVASRQSGR